MVRLDFAAAEGDSLRDDQPGAGFVVVIREIGDGNGDRKTRQAGKRGEAHLGLHLMLTAVVADFVAEISRELHEEIGMQRWVGMLELERQEQLLTRAATGTNLETRDSRNAIARGKRAKGLECLGQKSLAARSQSFTVRR